MIDGGNAADVSGAPALLAQDHKRKQSRTFRSEARRHLSPAGNPRLCHYRLDPPDVLLARGSHSAGRGAFALTSKPG